MEPGGQRFGSRDSRLVLRTGVLFFFLFLWMLLALGRAYYLAGPGRAKAVAEGERLARAEGRIPAARGRILDRNGVLLAWSERYFDLQSREELPEKAVTELLRIVPDIRYGKSHTGVLKRGLSPDQLVALEGVIRSYPGLRIVSRWERIAISTPAIRRHLGKVEKHGGELVGISGLEQQYDARLQGRAGAYRVLLDRYRNWIPDSWELTQRPQAGDDVQLPYTVLELEEREEELP